MERNNEEYEEDLQKLKDILTLFSQTIYEHVDPEKIEELNQQLQQIIDEEFDEDEI